VDAVTENIEHPESDRASRELRAIRERCAGHPVLDPRSADEILGYDEQGLPR
jgi:antitoxin VapB